MLADGIANILTQRVFNFQARGRLTMLLVQVRENLERQLRKGEPLNFFLLYNGGYRAAPLPSNPLIFAPDQTELMLLHQIALLHQKVSATYPPGIRFFIVINNGVGLWVNDIPLEATQIYVHELRQMIEWMDAAGRVSVVLQSELPGFIARPLLKPVFSSTELSDKEHQLVERFLGRSCSVDEARCRQALYAIAEARWAQDLWPVISAKDGLPLRQVAHPNMLSFRPFPGGAIRIQNGSLGFQSLGGSLTPKLITSETALQKDIMAVPWIKPWTDHAPASFTAAICHA